MGCLRGAENGRTTCHLVCVLRSQLDDGNGFGLHYAVQSLMQIAAILSETGSLAQRSGLISADELPFTVFTPMAQRTTPIYIQTKTCQES